jgi:hypothetical protein
MKISIPSSPKGDASLQEIPDWKKKKNLSVLPSNNVGSLKYYNK